MFLLISFSRLVTGCKRCSMIYLLFESERFPYLYFAGCKINYAWQDHLEIRITSAHFYQFCQSSRFTNFDISDEHCLDQQSNLECLAFSICFFLVELCSLLSSGSSVLSLRFRRSSFLQVFGSQFLGSSFSILPSCIDIERKRGKVCYINILLNMSHSNISKSVITIRREYFMNSVFVNPGIYSCSVFWKSLRI